MNEWPTRSVEMNHENKATPLGTSSSVLSRAYLTYIWRIVVCVASGKPSDVPRSDTGSQRGRLDLDPTGPTTPLPANIAACHGKAKVGGLGSAHIQYACPVDFD